MEPRRFKLLLWIGAGAALALLAIVAVTSFVLPAYVESRLIPGLTQQFGISPRQVHVRRIGWWGTDLGPIQFAAGDVPVVTIAAIQIDYSPLSLIRGQILGVAIGGLRLALEAGDEGITIPGVALPGKDASMEKASTPPDLRTLLPIRLNRFSIRQSEVIVAWNERRFTIPVEITLDTSGLHSGALKMDAGFSILGNPLTLTAHWDQGANLAQVELTGNRILLDSLVQTGQLPAGVHLLGKADIRAKGRVHLQPFGMALSLDAEIVDTKITTPHATITNATTEQAAGLPISVTIEAGNNTGIRWSCAPLQIQTPVSTRIEKLEGQWTPNDNGWTSNAEMTTRLAPQNLAPGVTLPQSLGIQWVAEVSRSDKNPIVFEVKAAADRPLELKNELVRMTNTDSHIDIKGRYADGALTADATAAMKGLQLRLADGKVEIPNPTIDTRLVLRPPNAEAGSEFAADIILSKVSSTFGSSLIRFPEFGIKITGRSAPDGPWQLKADISAANGLAIEKKTAIKLGGVDLKLPLHWPPKAGTAAGRINVRTIQWEKRQLGDLKGTLQQRPAGLDLALKHRSKLFPGLSVLVNGGMKDNGIRMEAKLPSYRLPEGTDLGQFMPAAYGLMMTGRVEGNCRLALQIGSIQSAGNFKFDQGSLRDADREIDLEGIRAEIAMEDLLNIRSGPRQKLRVDRLHFGNLTAKALFVDFQLEPNRTLFIEKAGLDWCDGRINTAAIRIMPDKDDYDVTLVCDRLNLAMVLDQLGAADASGEGSVNGRIPLRWTGGRLSFDNGFLYSTPGQTGAIKISGTEVLLSGLPPGTPQHTQLDIATEALKDYTYNWTKLSLNSDEEDLLLKLQFDGKPNRLLPFAYDKSLGQFKRVTGQGQADFKGISIDLNFNSPLNDIIHYKELLKQK